MMPSRVVVAIATLGPVGHVRCWSGTAGSAAGFVFFTVFFFFMPMLPYLLLTVAGIGFAALFCGEAEVRLQKIDPSEIVLDEFVVIPVCFIGMQPWLWDGRGWAVMLVGFLIFRFLDIVKPFGIRWLQRLHGGAGVVMDDVVAALATCLCLHLLARFTPIFGM